MLFLHQKVRKHRLRTYQERLFFRRRARGFEGNERAQIQIPQIREADSI